MKHLIKMGLCIAAFSMATSCADNDPLDFGVEKPESVALQEELDAYESLKTYLDRKTNPGFKLGAGVSLSEYTSRGVAFRLINSNFDEVTPGYEMKHGAIVQSDGGLSLTNVEAMFALTQQKGLTVFGHTLCWHANQNAAYLKGLISPLVVTAPAFANSLNISGLNDGTLNGWNYPNKGAGISVANSGGLSAGTKVIKLVSGAGSSGAEDLQLITPAIPVVEKHEYEVVFYIKSDVPGKGRIAFEGLSNNTPQVDWMGTGTASETFTTGLGWKAVKFKIRGFTGSSIKLHFDLGYVPDVNYYIDAGNLYVYDTQGVPAISNLVQNGNFEAGNPWGGWGNNSTRGYTNDGLGFGNTGKAFYVNNPSLTPNYWTVQTSYPFPGGALENGKAYKLSFWVKGTTAGVIRPEFQSENFSANGFGQVYVTTDWKKVELETTVTTADRVRLIISYGEFSGTVYLDDVVISKVGASAGGTTIVEKTAAEKKVIIDGALERWISGMVTASKDHVKAWDVVNEPMDDGKPYELKTGAGKTLAADEFYWQDYLGQDYAVTAFRLARKYGNQGDILFINDYNLEYNLDKCKGLIQYVKYLESQGVTVDGIGTQMHISINSSKEKIVEMFTLLAATGKQVKISEMDIGVGVKTNEATDEHYQAQADMYRFVVKKYMEIIPVSQRYGITVWSPKDSPANSSWRAGEPIGLWTEKYNRKRAYSGVSKGLAGAE
jgi:endo-1,4-beta-xylanase